MSTIGEQIIERINGIERRLDVYDRVGTAGGVGIPAEGFETFQNELKELKTRLAEIDLSGAAPTNQPRQFQSPKDWMPEILSQQYREHWRVWSYKTRDWLSQHDSTLPEKT